jgi:hypothetical protein
VDVLGWPPPIRLCVTLPADQGVGHASGRRPASELTEGDTIVEFPALQHASVLRVYGVERDAGMVRITASDRS